MKLLLTSVGVGRVTSAFALLRRDRPCAGSRRREEADQAIDNPAKSASLPRRRPGQSAFTMIEIAVCLAIIGFALVAIIGTLPAGLNVQRENREDTIITQEGNYFMEAIRTGARGLDELTNNVISITNYWRNYNTADNPWTPEPLPAQPDGYTPTRSYVTSEPVALNAFPLTNGMNIVGLLSKPKLEGVGGGLVRSNHVVALVRAITGAASEKFPQTNLPVLNLGLNYRMVAEVHNVPMNNSGAEYNRRVRENLREVRLKFSWPLFLPGDRVGNGRQTFRSLAGGQYEAGTINGQPVFFFNSATYDQITP